MVFAGYRLPSPIGTVGGVYGTNSSARYTVGATDPALYRSILSTTLTSSTSPRVATSTTVATPSASQAFPATVTYTASVSVPAPGTGTPTGSVAFTDGSAAISGCSAQPLNVSTGTASCTTSYTKAGTHQVTATYSGDSNYATSTSSALSEAINAPTTDLAISGSVNAGSTVGKPLTFVFTAQNLGPNDAADVMVSAAIPTAGVAFNSATSTQGSCVWGTPPVSTPYCALGAVPAGGSATVTVTLTPAAAGPISASATISGSVTDSNPSDDSTTVSTTVVATTIIATLGTTSSAKSPAASANAKAHDVALTGEGPSRGRVDDDLGYTFTIENTGKSTANDARLELSFTGDRIHVISTSTHCTGSDLLKCSIPKLDVHRSTKVHVVIKSSSPGRLAIKAEVVPDFKDPTPANDSLRLVTEVKKA